MLNFGSLESAVLECLWRREEPATVRDVAQELNVTRPLAYTTVMTVMDRLHRKGVLRREKAGHMWHYSTVHTPGKHAAAVMREVLDETRDRRAALASFAAGLDGATRRELRAVLDSFDDDGAHPTDLPADTRHRHDSLAARPRL